MNNTQQQSTNLDLSTLSQDAVITIDKKRYGVRHPDSLNLVDYKQLEFTLSRIGHLLQLPKAKLTKTLAAEAETLLVELMDMVLDAPDTVRAKLKTAQRLLILNVFTQLRSSATPAPKTEVTRMRRRRTGGTSSRR